MTTNSTRHPARLSLLELIDRGLLSRKAGLDLDDVLALEHPDDPASQAKLRAKIETAIRRRHRLARPYSIGDCPAGWVIRRKVYRAWRLTGCPADFFSESSVIDLWLGATPTAESILPAIPSLPEPVAVAHGGAAEKTAALQSLLAEIDKRAAEQGADFNRHCLPGTKAEFQELLNAYCPAFRYIGLPATADYLKGACKFQRGVKPKQGKGATVWALFPEYPDLKLG